jgi:hypothetical protein
MMNPPTNKDAPKASKGWTLQTPPDVPGQTHDQLMAKVAADGLVGNARTMVDFGAPTFGELSLTDCAMALKQTAQELNGGDLSAAVAMLAAQSVALNAMFGELARRASLNMGTHLDVTDRYLRLALKAQGQCRATLETLAAIKNPPVVFARQANINNGGQQQVNNGPGPPKDDKHQHERATAHAVDANGEMRKELADPEPCTVVIGVPSDSRTAMSTRGGSR